MIEKIAENTSEKIKELLEKDKKNKISEKQSPINSYNNY